MLDLNIRDLIDLMETECKNVEDRIQKMYQWDFNRTKLICQLSIGISASFLVLIGTSYVQNFTSTKPVTVDSNLLIVSLFLSICPAIFGIFQFYRLKSIHRQYVAALKLLHKLRAIRPFITYYRQTF